MHSLTGAHNLEAKNLPKLLASIQPLIEEGFGDQQIQELQGIGGTYTDASFRITYRGSTSDLKIHVMKYNDTELGIWIVTGPVLAAEIQKKMKGLLR